MPKSVQIASAVAYAASHEACAAHAKTRLAAPLRSFAAPLRSPTVFLRVQHMASCAARRGCELASVLQALESLRAKLILWCNNGLAGGEGMGMANGGMVMRARGDAAPIGTAR